MGVSKGKMGTGASPVWPETVSEEMQPQTQPFLNAWLPRSTLSAHRVCWQPPSRLVWRESLPRIPGVSPPELLSRWFPCGEPHSRVTACNLRTFPSLFSLLTCQLPSSPSCPTRLDKSFCPIIPCSRSPWPHDYLCADCQAAEFLDPLILSLFFTRWEEGEEVLFFLQLERCPPRLGCHEPWVSSTTAGLQLAPRALQLPAMFVSHIGAARAVCVGGDLLLTGKYSHINSYPCLIIYYVLFIWHIFPFNLCNDRTKSVLLPSEFFTVEEAAQVLAAIRWQSKTVNKYFDFGEYYNLVRRAVKFTTLCEK